MTSLGIPVAAISLLIELPRDLGLEENTPAAVVQTASAAPGWEHDRDKIPAWAPMGYDEWPDRRLRFRRAYVGIGMPTEAVDRTFGDLRRLKGLGRARYRFNLWRTVRSGAKEWKTVCQLTKWYVGDQIPDPPPDFRDPPADSAYRRDFFRLLDDLDLFLQAYGLISGELNVGALTLHDLPASIPWFIDLKRDPDDPGTQHRGNLRVHDHYPALLPATGDMPAGREAATIMATRAEGVPFFTAYTLLFQAQASARAGRRRQAVTDMGTAVESFVYELIRSAMQVRGSTRADLEALSRDRWTDVYNKTLLDVLGVPRGQGDRPIRRGGARTMTSASGRSTRATSRP